MHPNLTFFSFFSRVGINHQSNIGSWLLGLLHLIQENPELPVFFLLFFFLLFFLVFGGTLRIWLGKNRVVSCNSSIFSFKNCWSCLSSLFWFRIKQAGPFIDSRKFRKLDSYLPGNKRLMFGIFATFCLQNLTSIIFLKFESVLGWTFYLSHAPFWL